jgi:hypothetical protein
MGEGNRGALSVRPIFCLTLCVERLCFLISEKYSRQRVSTASKRLVFRG